MISSYTAETTHPVVNLNIRNLNTSLLKSLMLPSVRRPLHHSQSSIVVFVVMSIQENQFRPEMRLLASSNHLRDIDAAPEDA